MGATPYNGGVTFRLWAPFASDVQVQGDFNNWKPGTPLFSEGNGYWSADLPGAMVGQQSNYLLTNAASGAGLTHVHPYSPALHKRGGSPSVCPCRKQHPDRSPTQPAPY